MLMLTTDAIGSPMPRLRLAKSVLLSYRYRIGINCLQLFQLPRVPGLLLLHLKSNDIQQVTDRFGKMALSTFVSADPMGKFAIG